LDDVLHTAHRPDGIVLATPNALHVPQALACIEAGLPCLVEKPVATTLAEAQQLADEVDRKQVPVLVGHHRAHSPIMAQAQALIDSGRLGRLVGVMGSAVFCKPDGYFADAPWRTQPGGGPILINLIHEIHNLRMLLGEIVAVQAFQSHAVRQFAVEDTVAINFSFANGALGSFMLSDAAACAKSWEQTSQENPSYATYPDEDCYVVMGTQGSLSIPTMRLRTHQGGQESSWYKPMALEQVPLDRQDPIQLQMAHFARVIRGLVAPLVTVRDGLANLQVTEAIVRAAHSGHAVKVQGLR
jgi:predicted dehydrogenase